MQRSLIILVTIVNLLFSGFSRASAALSDFELAAVSGGGIDPHLQGQSLPQQPQQPGSNNANYQPPQPIRNDDGMELNPEVFAIMQSSADLRRARVLLLKGSTQQQATGLNLDNAVTSDIVSTNNIFDGGDLTVEDVTTAIEINQVNNLAQFHRSQGSLSSSLAGYRHETIVYRESGSESFDYHVFSSIYQQRRSEIRRNDYLFSKAQVGDQFASLDEINANAMPIALISPQQFGTFLAFREGEVVDTGLFGEFGAELEYTGVTITGLGITLDNIAAGGINNNDLLLGSSVILPELDLGILDLKACIVKCVDPTLNLGSLGGNSVPFTINVPGFGPQVDELNLGFGFALSGTAPVLQVEPGSLTINGDVAIKITPFARLTLDFSQLEILGLNVGTLVKGLKIFKDENGEPTDKVVRELELSLLDKQIEFLLLDREFGSDQFETMPGDPITNTNEVVTQDNDTVEIYRANDVAESAVNQSYQYSILIGGQMTGAEAELLAMSESNLSVDYNNSISMAGHAQQGMRIFNSVNAVSSVAANAMNISRLPVLSGESPAMTQISMLQRNHFNQQR